jgi:hypothetical protein
MSTATYSTDQVRRDAIAAGHSPKVADYLVRQIGLDQTRVKAGELRSKPAGTPSPLSRSARTAAPRASLTTATAGASLRSVAAMYGPRAVALVPRFVAVGLSTKQRPATRRDRCQAPRL